MKHVVTTSIFYFLPSLYAMDNSIQTSLLENSLKTALVRAIKNRDVGTYRSLLNNENHTIRLHVLLKSEKNNEGYEKNDILDHIYAHAYNRPPCPVKRLARTVFGMTTIGYSCAFAFHNVRCDERILHIHAGFKNFEHAWNNYSCSSALASKTCLHITSTYMHQQFPVCTSQTETFSWLVGTLGLSFAHGILQIKSAICNDDGKISQAKSQEIMQLTENFLGQKKPQLQEKDFV
ncbi:MAG TPA: hypothetical protein VEK38_01445 [Candidatus Bathyarchaeia archaeon]|nr:hypothetical protein [Candidatus Bathyarchaeia archaeon]